MEYFSSSLRFCTVPLLALNLYLLSFQKWKEKYSSFVATQAAWCEKTFASNYPTWYWSASGRCSCCFKFILSSKIYGVTFLPPRGSANRSFMKLLYMERLKSSRFSFGSCVLVAPRRIELLSPPWKGSVLTIRRWRHMSVLRLGKYRHGLEESQSVSFNKIALGGRRRSGFEGSRMVFFHAGFLCFWASLRRIVLGFRGDFPSE